jgi:hypothetical protein
VISISYLGAGIGWNTRRKSYRIIILTTGDNLQLPKFTRDCDTVITYLENDVLQIFRSFCQKTTSLCIPNHCDMFNFGRASDSVITISVCQGESMLRSAAFGKYQDLDHPDIIEIYQKK